MVEAMDLAVGKVLAKLDELNLRKNTLVIFTSDNGGLSTSEGWPTSNLPLRGSKGWMYEGGYSRAADCALAGGHQGGQRGEHARQQSRHLPHAARSRRHPTAARPAPRRCEPDAEPLTKKGGAIALTVNQSPSTEL